MNGKFPGLYRGTVVLNTDPEFRARLILTIPDVAAFIPSTWVEPCAPLSGPPGPMGVYMVPPPGAGVWVMFEGGNCDKPVWLGCRFDTPADPPIDAKLSNPVSPSLVLQTLAKNTVVISDLPPTPLTGGIVLRSTTGAMIVVNDSGIYLNNGKGAQISMVAKAIDFNLGAMTII